MWVDMSAHHEHAHMGHTDHSGHHMEHSAYGNMMPAAHVHSSASGCDGGMGGHHDMKFHFGFCEIVLFDCWKVNSIGTLIASMLGIFILSALYEGLKYFREYLFWRTYNSVPYRAVQVSGENTVVADNQVMTMVGEVISKQPVTMFSQMHIFQTLLHVIQLTISYFLMLIFMTFNVWLCLAVVLGAATGYFLFGWKKSVVVDVTEHCH